ncbi:MAG: zinc ribbon domain-containing protein [Chloroflexi bacterium]|nr:zinc ribbon domain-containing protein [Chloroflexota bacterium]
MPLIKCPDCGKEISKSAEACPNCGKPNKSKPANIGCCGGCLVILAVLFILGSIISLFEKHNPPSSPPPPPITSSPKVKAENPAPIVKANAVNEKSIYTKALGVKVERTSDHEYTLDKKKKSGVFSYRPVNRGFSAIVPGFSGNDTLIMYYRPNNQPSPGTPKISISYDEIWEGRDYENIPGRGWVLANKSFDYWKNNKFQLGVNYAVGENGDFIVDAIFDRIWFETEAMGEKPSPAQSAPPPKNSKYYKKAQEAIQSDNQKLNELITVKYGSVYLCEDCGKSLKRFVKTKTIKRVNEPDYQIKEIKQGVCQKCKQKRIVSVEEAKKNFSIWLANKMLNDIAQEMKPLEMKDTEIIYKDGNPWGIRGTFYKENTPIVSETIPYNNGNVIMKNLLTGEEKSIPKNY